MIEFHEYYSYTFQRDEMKLLVDQLNTLHHFIDTMAAAIPADVVHDEYHVLPSNGERLVKDQIFGEMGNMLATLRNIDAVADHNEVMPDET